MQFAFIVYFEFACMQFYYEARDECLRRVFRDRYHTLFGERKRRQPISATGAVTPSPSRPQSPTPSERESFHGMSSTTDMGTSTGKRGSRASSVADEQEIGDTQSVASQTQNPKSPEELEREEADDRDEEERMELNMPTRYGAFDNINGDATDANSSDAH